MVLYPVQSFSWRETNVANSCIHTRHISIFSFILLRVFFKALFLSTFSLILKNIMVVATPILQKDQCASSSSWSITEQWKYKGIAFLAKCNAAAIEAEENYCLWYM